MVGRIQFSTYSQTTYTHDRVLRADTISYITSDSSLSDIRIVLYTIPIAINF